MKDWSISTRLGAAFALLLLLLLGLAGAAYRQMGHLHDSSRDLSDSWLPSVAAVAQVKAQAIQTRVFIARHILNADAKAIAELDQSVRDARGTLETQRKQYEALISGTEERSRYEAFDAVWRQYTGINDRLLAQSRQNEKDAARALFEGESLQRYTQAVALLDQLVKVNGDGAKASRQTSEDSYTTGITTLALTVALAFAVAVAAALWLIRSITPPLVRAVQAADLIAGGDLTQTVVSHSKDEAGRLLQALDSMQQSLVHTVRAVRHNAESVATGSAQIASGNNDLSARTESQASALEQTAASMEQLDSAVQQNADNARQANQLAERASDVAAQGGEMVAQVVATMKDISASSSRIADIIGVIDGIAFQTNILALNAAVEAARAGEQGRGFAVVAGEVRLLAGRSAEAAKEIKGLITASVERVEHGSTQVDQAGRTMAEVVAAIRRVADIMAEISAASREQSAGVSQVGEAVMQLDQTTQQNSALVEEMAAAAASLSKQATDLVQAVAVFRLG
ncbi:methyl-accepting chemotaxis protein [Pseudorhodoferax sp.]|uniref:methyl-accepting chemotaxis protein n=1 Tax=Pseudorhodoferax sp. TaxID=1993553 RepID=UPI002DD691F0|nr:methyl-accepting chemotaxis protein [Pseudorhodoferax sp.]